MLPGESLSKYNRNKPTKSTPQPAAAMGRSSDQPAGRSTFQPSTMVTAPLAWDGGETLPGESISRYRNRAPLPALEPAATTESHQEIEEVPSAKNASDFTDRGAATEGNAAEDHNLYEHTLSEHPLAQHPLHQSEEIESTTETLAVDPGHSDDNPGSDNSEPAEASASYRFDPSAPSAYRQSSVTEPEANEIAPGHPEFEPIENARRQAELETATDQEDVETAVQEHPRSEPVHEAASRGTDIQKAPEPEPFLGQSVSIAQPVATHESLEQTQTSSLAAEAFHGRAEFPDTEGAESSDEENEEDEPAERAGTHAFDPGQGQLEEETIDEEEADTYAAQASLDDAEYDELIEETLDVQMDSGLLSELVRDKHIDQRTRFVEGEGAGTALEEGRFDAPFEEESAGLELEDVPDIEEMEQGEASEADAARERSNQPRNNRRGVRGQRPGQGGNRGRMRRSTAQTSSLPVITELLKPNQEILVQIAKEPIARKGARITSHIALPGRFLVFMPTVNHVGVSRKISSDEERQRLKHILLSEKGAASGGFIVRTAAATASEEDLRADIRFLLTLWSEIKQRADSAKPPALIYHDLSLVERVLRDQVTDNFSAIWVDSEQDYERVLRFLNRFEPSLVRRVKLYTKETPLFEQFGIQEEINKALRSKVWLKSGGSIVINQTEALVAIDINTGKYVGKTARLEDTILKTNLDAIPEIVRQIRLRDLGGIIVIDFIDMDERKNRNKVMQALEDALKSDRAPSKVLQFNDFGLVAITRKRVKQSLERTLSVPCYTCTGTGMVKGPLTVCNEIYIELRKMHRQLDRGDVLLRVHPEVVKQLKANNGRWLSEMEEMSGKTIIVKSDATLHPEQFDIH